MKVTVTNYRNPIFFDASNNIIDLDIETVQYGWIPTTIIMDDGDPAEHTVQIKQWLTKNQNLIAPYVPYIRPLEELKTSKVRYIESARDVTLKEPSGTVTTPDGLVWQVDPTSMQQLNDAMTTFSIFGGTPEGFVWRDVNNTNHPATLQFLAGIAASRAVQVQGIWTKSWGLKAQLDAAFAAQDRTAMESILW